MKKILVVSGNDQDLAILSSLLAKSGYSVVAESDGSSALAILDSEELDVIISDYCLPDMDGAAFITSLKNALPDFPSVIFLSDRGDVEDYLAALGIGAFEFLFRPFHPRELLRIVNVAGAAGDHEHAELKSIHENVPSSLFGGQTAACASVPLFE